MSLEVTINERSKIDGIIQSLPKGKLKKFIRKAEMKGQSLEEYIHEKEVSNGNMKASNRFKQNPILPFLTPDRKIPVKAMSLSKQIDVTNHQKKWKKFTHDNKPSFDVQGFYQPLLNNIFDWKDFTLTSSEMMEFFLKSIGHKSPFGLSQKGTGQNTTWNLLTGIEHLLMGDIPFKESESDINIEISHIKLDGYKWFCEHEHLITNNEMFWAIAKIAWVTNSDYFTEEMFSRYGRTDMSLEDRQKCIATMDLCNNILMNDFGRQHNSLHSEIKDLKETDDIKIFRGFKVQVGKPIRKGVSKYSDDGHIHDEGSSFSYSKFRMPCYRTQYPISQKMIEKHTDVSDREVSRMLGSWLDGVKENETYYDGFYNAIGEFRVKKKDILFMTDSMSEYEYVINPKNVILDDYEICNSLDFFAMKSVMHCSHYINHLHKKKTKKQLPLTSLVNCDGMYQSFRGCIGMIAKEKPDLLKTLFMKEIDAPHFILNNLIIPKFIEYGLIPNITKHMKDRSSILQYRKFINDKEDDLYEFFIGDWNFPLIRNGVRSPRTFAKKYKNTNIDFDKMTKEMVELQDSLK